MPPAEEDYAWWRVNLGDMYEIKTVNVIGGYMNDGMYRQKKQRNHTVIDMLICEKSCS